MCRNYNEMRPAVLAVLLLIPWQTPTVSVPFDLTGVRPGPISVVRSEASVTVAWPDETGRIWRATFSLDPAQPLVTSIGPDGEAVVRAARPFYQGETGKRRGGWNAFFDDPTSHPDGTRHVQSNFKLRAATARSVGQRVEILFDGLRMGSFDGGLAYTFYPGSRLIQQEAVLTTYDADVAYYYDAGLDMAAVSDRQPGNNMRTEAAYYDTGGALRRIMLNGLRAERVPVQVRYRTLALKTAGGSVAVFPAPHQYFFPRDFTSNLGFVWHRAWRGRAALGIRQLRDENWQFYPWVNAPPGRPQRMSVFFVLSADGPETALAHVLRYTNGGSLSSARRIQDAQHALASRLHGSGDGQWVRMGAAVQAGSESDGRRRVDDHGLSRRRPPQRSHRPAARRVARVLRRAAGAVGSGFPVDSGRGSKRPPGRALGARFSEAGLLVHESAAERRTRLDTSEIRHRVQRGGREGDVRPRTARGRIHVSDASTDEGVDGVSGRILGDRSLPRCQLLGAGWKAMPSDLSSPRLGDRAFDLWTS